MSPKETKCENQKACIHLNCKGSYETFPFDYKYCPYCGRRLEECKIFIDRQW